MSWLYRSISGSRNTSGACSPRHSRLRARCLLAVVLFVALAVTGFTGAAVTRSPGMRQPATAAGHCPSEVPKVQRSACE